MSITVIIIAITVLISLAAFRSPKLLNDLIFDSYAVTNRGQYYRFITSGFIHADVGHLFFNMYAFYLFGKITEQEFDAIFGSYGKLLYIAMYLLALIVCLIPSYSKNKDNPNYRSLGASGAVSAVVFAFILFNPLQGIGLVFIPVYLAGFLFGFIYLFVSYLLDKKGGGRINHSAHIWGALFGIAFLIVAAQLFSGYPVLGHFLDQVRNMDPRQIITTGHAF
ncbi:MAG TPA: rhomboid family intramembrane serine protease [Chitinophagaceae bacterium]|nr:rhomboid family intramembrane serine protease [Chitinophagaceae bacterium]